MNRGTSGPTKGTYVLQKLEKGHRVLNYRLIVHIFQVMIQPHNRKISFSLYISALAVADTIVVVSGKISYLGH